MRKGPDKIPDHVSLCIRIRDPYHKIVPKRIYAKEQIVGTAVHAVIINKAFHLFRERYPAKV